MNQETADRLTDEVNALIAKIDSALGKIAGLRL
jgi:hypothetical protein